MNTTKSAMPGNFWAAFEKKALANYIPGVKNFRQGYRVIDKLVRSGKMNEAGEIAGNIAKRKELAGKAMAHGTAKMTGTALLAHHLLKTKEPNAG